MRQSEGALFSPPSFGWAFFVLAGLHASVLHASDVTVRGRLDLERETRILSLIFNTRLKVTLTSPESAS
jgi:hypothetical protein